MSRQLDLEITNYSDEDLIDLLELSEPITDEKVFSKIDKYKKKYKSRREIYKFFVKVEERMSRVFNAIEGMEGMNNEVVENDDDVVDIGQVGMNSDDLILTNDVNELNTNNPNFNKGSQELANINLSRKQIKQIINVDSSFRKDYLSTNSNDFTFTLPIKLQNVVSLRLSSIEMPNTFYLFSNTLGNTTFKMRVRLYEDNSYSVLVKSQELNIVIPEGTWENGELTSRLNRMFEAFDEDKEYGLFRNFVFDIEDSNIRPLIRFKSTALEEETTLEFGEGENVEYDLIFDETLNEEDYMIDGYVNPALRNTAGWILGFRKARYENIRYDNTLSFFSDTLHGIIRGEALYAADKFNYIFFSVNDFNNSKDSIISAYKDVFISNNILGRISIKFGTFFINLDDAGDGLYKQRDYTGPVTLEKLHIQVLNRYGELLDFNNADFSLTFEIVQLL